MSSTDAALPLPFDYPPMEAESADALPDGAGWQYEPKFDGFRCLAFRDGGTIELRSKSGQPLGRYFPDVVAALGAVAAPRFVLDGEIVIPEGAGSSFEALQMRLHPAASRVRKLAAEQPARYVLFDLLVDADGRDLTGRPLIERRAAAEKLMPRLANAALVLAPLASGRAVAEGWLARPAVARSGRSDGEAARQPVPLRQARRDGEGEAPAHRRLRGRRLPLSAAGAGGRLAAARSL
jgi:ATP-dependent DNA ligase